MQDEPTEHIAKEGKQDGAIRSLADRSHRPHSHPNQHTEAETSFRTSRDDPLFRWPADCFIISMRRASRQKRSWEWYFPAFPPLPCGSFPYDFPRYLWHYTPPCRLPLFCVYCWNIDDYFYEAELEQFSCRE